MKLFSRISIVLASLLILSSSCSIEKRVYRKGYHVVWNKKQSHELKKAEDLKTENIVITKKSEPEELIVSTNLNRENDIVSLKKRPVIISNKDTCGDVILLQNADEIVAKILEIDDRNIKYKRCDNINGPTYSISKTKVALIKYANGTKEVVIQEPVYNQPITDKRIEPELPRKINPLGLASLLGYILLSILSRGYSFALLSGTMIVLVLLLSVAPIIMAYISLFQFKREPKRYYGKWMPITVVCLYLAALLIIALVFASLGAVIGVGAGPLVGFFLILFLLFLGLLIAALIPKATPPTSAK